MKHHPLSHYFPMLPIEEYNALKDSIGKHGLREAIVLLDGQILDGRNRYKACQEANVEPRFEEYEKGKDGALDFVMDMNFRRRHLLPTQKAQIIIDIEGVPKIIKDEDKGRMAHGLDVATATSPTYPGQAKRAGVSRETLARVVTVQDSPEIKKKVRSGEIKSAREATRLRKKEDIEKDVIVSTWQSLYAKAPEVKLIINTLGQIAGSDKRGGVYKWLDNKYGLDKIDPQGHTPLLIKKVDQSIEALQWFKTALEELRDG